MADENELANEEVTNDDVAVGFNEDPEMDDSTPEPEPEPTDSGEADDTPEPQAAAEESAEPLEAAEAPVAEPEYVLDPTFSVLDGQAEFEDWAKEHIKDKETEEKFRDLYSRAFGIDVVKQDRQVLREHNSALIERINEFEPVRQELDGAISKLKQGDFESFKDAFGIDDNTIFQYALNKINLADAPPEVQQQYQQAREVAQQNEQLRVQNEQLQNQFKQDVVSRRAEELNHVLSDESVSDFAQAFDERVGTPGAFRMEVIQRGQAHYQQTGQDLAPDQIVGFLLSAYGAGQPQAQQTQQASPQAGNAPQVVKERPPVIPSLPGRSTSPVKKAPRSLADIKAIAQSMNA